MSDNITSIWSWNHKMAKGELMNRDTITRKMLIVHGTYHLKWDTVRLYLSGRKGGGSFIRCRDYTKTAGNSKKCRKTSDIWHQQCSRTILMLFFWRSFSGELNKYLSQYEQIMVLGSDRTKILGADRTKTLTDP